MRDKPRSRVYQHFFNELSWDPHDMPATEAPALYNDRLACLRDTLSDHLWRLIDCHATTKQRQAARFIALGYTQTETAKIVGRQRQTTIQKALFGNRDYQRGIRGSLYGGLKAKVQYLIRQDYVIQSILAELKEEMPEPTLEKLAKQIENLTTELTNINKRLNEVEREKTTGPYKPLKSKKENDE